RQPAGRDRSPGRGRRRAWRRCRAPTGRQRRRRRDAHLPAIAARDDLRRLERDTTQRAGQARARAAGLRSGGMEFLPTDWQRQLQDSVARLLAEAGGVKRMRALRGKAAGFESAVHARMAAAGWYSLPVPVEHGGLGLGATELALVLMEAGRALAPEPIAATM